MAARSRRYRLGGGPGTAGRLRDLSAQAVTDWYGPPVTPAAKTAAADVLLLVTELVAHAVRRGGAPYELRLDRSADGVWVQVSDTAPGRPLPQDEHRSRPAPCCLYLIQRLAAAWGSVPREHGRTVWCEVPFPSADPSARAV
ncbi:MULTISPECIES: ATP-binding protein [Streptomyces]|uniref:ATP-binding protein n=2 Tax=Streptomyces TaxID=1883 RepID=A0ABU4K711_9ACTN|nr:ATP-binding protein [Streptomyces roseolus]MDX2293541.1 ATP-binding protein [Streptomyces roseolus]